MSGILKCELSDKLRAPRQSIIFGTVGTVGTAQASKTSPWQMFQDQTLSCPGGYEMKYFPTGYPAFCKSIVHHSKKAVPAPTASGVSASSFTVDNLVRMDSIRNCKIEAKKLNVSEAGLVYNAVEFQYGGQIIPQFRHYKWSRQTKTQTVLGGVCVNSSCTSSHQVWQNVDNFEQASGGNILHYNAHAQRICANDVRDASKAWSQLCSIEFNDTIVAQVNLSSVVIATDQRVSFDQTTDTANHLHTMPRYLCLAIMLRYPGDAVNITLSHGMSSYGSSTKIFRRAKNSLGVAEVFVQDVSANQTYSKRTERGGWFFDCMPKVSSKLSIENAQLTIKPMSVSRVRIDDVVTSIENITDDKRILSKCSAVAGMVNVSDDISKTWQTTYITDMALSLDKPKISRPGGSAALRVSNGYLTTENAKDVKEVDKLRLREGNGSIYVLSHHQEHQPYP